MNRIEIFETGHYAELPSSWDEMTSEQVQYVFRTFDYCVRHDRSPLEFNVRVLYHFLGIKPKAKNMVRNANTGKMAENIYMLCDNMFAFMFKDSDKIANLSFDSLKNPLPIVRMGGRRYYGPADLLADMTFGDFRRASTALNTFFASQEESDLDECIAYLYRRRAKTPDRAGRMICGIDGNILEKSVRIVSRFRSWQKNLIMLWFSACISYLQTGVVMIDGEAVNMSNLFEGDEEKASDVVYNWNDMLVEIAKEQTIGTIDRVDEEPLFSIFWLMWHNYKERKRYEKIDKV